MAEGAIEHATGRDAEVAERIPPLLGQPRRVSSPITVPFISRWRMLPAIAAWQLHLVRPDVGQADRLVRVSVANLRGHEPSKLVGEHVALIEAMQRRD